MPIIEQGNKNFPIVQKRDHTVVKSNDLIQKSRYELNILQNKVMLYLISMIKPTDDITQVYTFLVNDFCQVCGLDSRHGKNVKNAKDAIQLLADKSVWIEKPNGEEILLRWLNQVKLTDGKSRFEVTFHPDMMPYLYDLQERYTSYKLSNVLPMKSKYGVRLYELLKSYQHMNTNTITFLMGELSDRLGAQKYERYADFKRRVLDTAMEDINEYSDLDVEYTPYSASGKQRGFDGIKFTINEPTALDKEMRAIRQERKLDSQTKATFKTLIEAITPEN